MNVISIQSQVAYGHVGNSAAVFPMQMHGIDVIAVPTTLLSNRPGYPTIRGRVLDAQLVADLLLGIEERGAVDTAQMILSGYLGSPGIAAVVADFVKRAKAKNPALRYCCDPVLGDRDRGLFVHADIPPQVADRLCPLADIVTPNHFEFEYLSGAKAATIDQVIEAARALMAHGPSTVVVTSAELSDTPGAKSRRSPSSVQRHGACARQNCRSARTAPATCLPRCWWPLASAGTTRRMRLAMPRPPSSPCWNAPLSARPRRCASSRAPSCSPTRSADSNVSQ